MSAAISQPDRVGTAERQGAQGRPGRPGYDGPVPAEDGEQGPVGAVVVRRNAGLAALVGAAASAVAIAYLWRATQSGAPLDWALCAVMAAIGAAYLANLVDARTPLLVADELGLRARLGHQWRGLPWDAVGSVAVQPRRGWRDGRLMFAPHSPGRALDGLDARARRAAATNQRVCGAALAVPVGLTTRSSVPAGGLVERLELLARGRAEVVLMPATEPDTSPPRDDQGEPLPVAEAVSDTLDTYPAGVDADADADADADESGGRPARRRGSRSLVTGLGAVASRLASPRGDTLTNTPADDVDERFGDRPGDAAVLGSAALQPDGIGLADGSVRRLPEEEELRRGPQPFDDGRVRPLVRLGDAVDPLVVEDVVTGPAHDPVIGPELAAARTRVGLSVDELAERTRIRPHVIESIEVDDFAPCGGDFYARGHLRTLARVLGRDPAPLLEQFDRRYATAPVSARTVFEAELATGMTGSMRSTAGGASWPLLVGVVLALVLTWGVVRLFASEPAETLQSPVPVLHGAAGAGGDTMAARPAGRPEADAAAPGPAHVAPARAVEVRLVAAHAPSHVVVRDRTGAVVWAGDLSLNQARTLRATPPVEVRAGDAGAIDVAVDGHASGRVGVLGQPGHRSFHRPAPG